MHTFSQELILQVLVHAPSMAVQHAVLLHLLVGPVMVRAEMHPVKHFNVLGINRVLLLRLLPFIIL